MAKPDVHVIDRHNENIRAHDRAAYRYERDHVEIFNGVEQERLRGRLADALGAVRTGTTVPLALDLGAGTGNLTAHFLALGARVVAADVSARSLELLGHRSAGQRCETVLLGTDGLAPLHRYRFDVAALYSVLHHVPDYVGFLRDALALLPPGGVVYIDHEPSPDFWSPPTALREWRRRAPTLRSRLHLLQQVATPTWLAYRARRLRDPRATLEGDIHVWPDDHVDWTTVDWTLAEAGFEIVSVRDHLQYRKHDDLGAYREFASRCTDTRSLIGRRTG